MNTVDYPAVSASLILGQYASAVRLAEVVSLVARQFQEVETALWELRTLLAIPDAVGAQLDILGRILGLPRSGRDDTTYRIALMLRAMSSHLSGTPEAVIESILSATGAPGVEYSPAYPAAYQVLTGGGNPTVEKALFEYLSPAGVGFEVSTYLVDVDDALPVLDENNQYILIKGTAP